MIRLSALQQLLQKDIKGRHIGNNDTVFSIYNSIHFKRDCFNMTYKISYRKISQGI